MYNREYNNEYRFYPFKDKNEVLYNILDINLLVSNNYILPIKITEIFTNGKYIGITLKDNTDKFIGVFSSVHKELNPRAKGCNGTIKFSDTIPDFLGERQQVDIEVDIGCVKLYENYSVPYLEVKQYQKDPIQLTGDITIEETDFSKLSIESNELLIKCPYLYKPKCNDYGPIKSINEVTPTSTGTIYLQSLSPHINIEVLDSKRILVSSELNSVDFDKRALTDAIGPIGEQGVAGRDGLDGQNAGIEPVVEAKKDYGGGYYDQTKFFAKNFDGRYIELIGDGNLVLGKNQYWVDINPYITSNKYTGTIIEYTPLCLYSYNGFYYIGDSAGYVHKIDTEGTEVEATHVADKVFGIAYSEDKTVYLSTGELHLNGAIYPISGCNKVKIINNDLYLLFDEGRYKIWDKMDVNLGDTRRVLDTDGTWFVGSEGLLYKDFKNYSSVINCLYDLTSIDTKDSTDINDNLTMICGSRGSIYKFQNQVWSKIPSPTIKNWKSTKIKDNSVIWIFGGKQE